MKNLLRKTVREYLKKECLNTIQKHGITTIAVMGDGQTSLIRELLYQILKTKFPVRRNIEMSDLEFSIPLTILGIQKYPNNMVDWLEFLAKYNIRKNKINPYKHYLILELSAINPKILHYWLDITKPETALIIGKVPIDISEYNFKKLVKISSIQNQDPINSFKLALIQVARFYQISEDIVQNAFEEKNLPNSKIRFFPGKNNSSIIDATHFHRPAPLESVIDMIENKNIRKIIFTDNKNDYSYLKKQNILKNWLINPSNFTPQNEDIIIIRGPRPDKLTQLNNIFR